MTDEQIKRGDTAKPKSSGPSSTVERVDSDEVVGVWPDNDTLERPASSGLARRGQGLDRRGF